MGLGTLTSSLNLQGQMQGHLHKPRRIYKLILTVSGSEVSSDGSRGFKPQARTLRTSTRRSCVLRNPKPSLKRSLRDPFLALGLHSFWLTNWDAGLVGTAVLIKLDAPESQWQRSPDLIFDPPMSFTALDTTGPTRVSCVHRQVKPAQTPPARLKTDRAGPRIPQDKTRKTL